MKKKIQSTLTAGLLRTLALLPYGLVARLGETLGSLLYSLPSKRKRILHTNLRLCFPEKQPEEREALARSTFRHVIRSYFERGIQWYGSASQIRRLVQLESAIELQDSYEQPTIFMGFHFAAIEATCMYYSIMHPVASIYTPMSDTVTETISRTQRSRFGTEMISRHGSAREILRVLKSGKPIMLAADMDFGLRDSVFVPFFGIQACTLTAVSRLAQLSGARVVPFVAEVVPGYKGYKLHIFEALDNFPSGDVHADALCMNQFLEARIRLTPDQYYWVHRRFKRRPEGEPSVY
ncbi:lipid A biosynthesis lauroyl acyltransferase [Pollutimonas harenae]|uniref:Lipid A biosynthesis lauroyl acyltransferase n=1 Tax=Pollutimonas harenae TaxID=657015 RepID=A0A853H683_9BURK|nr:lipid A biosynthesis lauroyl acyltransferase [Pollutimonas harenae]NYT86665.1 lipid A biosynthesis lauroyl acyltransferase [Pollutimonas harenae]TEA71319.1 lipid A biosynthesis lauroyl acyltransferase [Pollutimonas harenae]